MKLSHVCAAAVLLLAVAAPLATAQPPSPDGSPVMDINTVDDFFAAWNNKTLGGNVNPCLYYIITVGKPGTDLAGNWPVPGDLLFTFDYHMIYKALFWNHFAASQNTLRSDLFATSGGVAIVGNTTPWGPQPAVGSPVWVTVFDNCAAAAAGHDPQRGYTVTPMLQKMMEHGLFLETLANGNFVKAFFESGAFTGCRDRVCMQALSQNGQLPVVGQCGGCARPYLDALAQVTAIKAALPAGSTYKDCLNGVKAGWNPT